MMEKWRTKGGILIMSYNMFRVMVCKVDEYGERSRTFLQSPGADLVFADEAHLLKNEKAEARKAPPGS